MNRKERQIRTALKQGKVPELSVDQKRDLDRLVKSKAGTIKWLPGKSLLQSLWDQAAYISPFTWVFQLAFLLAGVLLLQTGAGTAALKNLSGIIPLAALIGIPELTKSFNCGMWELEESCFYNLRQLILLKMILFGLVDAILLLLLMAVAGNRGTSLTEAFLYIVIPFNLSGACYLGLFRVLKRRCSGYVLAAAGSLVLMGSLILYRYPPLDIEAWKQGMGAKAVWLAAGCSVGLLAGVGSWLIHGIEKEEIMVWNFE